MSDMTETTEREWLSIYLFFNGWIYNPECDRVIVDVVEPFVRRCQAQGWVDQYFYIRYSEFGPHVRLRFLGAPEVLSGEVWPALVEHLRAHNPEVKIDERPETAAVPPRPEDEPIRVTHAARVEYEPETERYGGPHALLVSERQFQSSSDASFALTSKMTAERSSRLGKGLLSMVVLVHVLTENRERGAAFAQMYSTNYLRSLVREDGGRDAWLDAFDQGFSQQSETLMEYVDAVWEAMDDGDTLSDTLDAYAAGLRVTRDELRALFDEGRVEVGGETAPDWSRVVHGIGPSYVHMMNNRLGITLQEESYLGYLVTRALGRTAEAVRAVPPMPPPPASHDHPHDHDHADGHDHAHPHDHAHDHGHDHAHDHAHDHGHDHAHDHGHDHAHDHGHDHAHDHGHDHAHDHGHDHAHDHGHDHAHDHGHDHAHDHGHDHAHDHADGHDPAHPHDHGDAHQHDHEHRHEPVAEA